MSGHSKWSTIKHSKAVSDARRGKLFTKLTREIIVAAQQGGDPDMNVRLRLAIQRAKDDNMPADTIERAIRRGDGSGSEQDKMHEVVYEGYGPGGTAILLQILTDNRNRTASDVRSTFTKGGGNLAQAGAVAWQFDRKGVIVVEAAPDVAEELTLAAIDAGADEFDSYDSTLEVHSTPGSMEDIRRALVECDANIRSSELAILPNNTVSLDEKTAARALRLLDSLEELDDVQRVFSNADFPDDVLEKYRSED